LAAAEILSKYGEARNAQAHRAPKLGELRSPEVRQRQRLRRCSCWAAELPSRWTSAVI